MSAERRWAQRRFRLEESTTQNGGARTIFVETMSPGTTVPPHFHKQFSETFDLISGGISIFTNEQPDLDALEASGSQVEVGKPATVKPQLYHKYKVDDDKETVLRVTLTPGNANFEKLLMIMNGLGADGQLEKLGDSVVLMAVIMDLSDAYLIGPAKDMLDGVRAEKKAEIEALKTEVLAKYDTDEALQALLA